jgi:hypothetical protein
MTKATSWVHLQFVSSNLNRYLIEEARCSAITEGIMYLSTLEDADNYFTALHTFQTMESSSSDGYEVLEYLISCDQANDILQKFDGIPLKYNLTDKQMQEHNALRTLYELEQQHNYKYDFTPDEIIGIKIQLDSKFDAVSIKANDLLISNNPLFTNDIIFSSSSYGVRNETMEVSSDFLQKIVVYPNPTVETVLVELPAINQYQSYSLTNAQGQVLRTDTIAANTMALTIRMTDCAQGVYALTLHARSQKSNVSINIMKQ